MIRLLHANIPSDPLKAEPICRQSALSIPIDTRVTDIPTCRWRGRLDLGLTRRGENPAVVRHELK